MRTALVLVASLAVLAAPSLGIGGVALHGAGLGTERSNDGTSTCAAAPFAVEALYTQDGHALLHSEFLGGADCLGTVGTSALLAQVAANTSASPPVRLAFFCTGSEAAGLDCAGYQGSVLITAHVEPYGGPGSSVGYRGAGAFFFDGTFTAV